MWGSTISFDEYPVEEAMRLMRAAGCTRVEMWKGHLKRCRTETLRREFVRCAEEEFGLEMGALNVVGEPYFKPFGTHEELKSTLDGLKEDANLALSLGVRDVLIWEGIRPKGLSDSECEKQLLPRLIEMFQSAIQFAKPHNVRFLTEPHPFTVGINDQFLINLCDALDPAHFGVLYDCCHYGVGQPSDYTGAVLRLGRRIRHIHFSDSDQVTSELHYAPGTGKMNLQAVLQAFKIIGYDGTLTLDLYGNPTPDYSARRSAGRVKEACQFLGLAC
jgi:sugar phosphate isomerase/epimerase